MSLLRMTLESGAGVSGRGMVISFQYRARAIKIDLMRIEGRAAPLVSWHGSYSTVLSFLNPWVLLGAAGIAVGLFVSGCIHGETKAEKKLAIVEASHQAAAEQARANAREVERKNNAAVFEANENAQRELESNNTRFIAELDRIERMRKPAPRASGTGSVPRIPITTTYCVGASGPSRDELLGYWKTLAGLLREASDDRAALEACVASWPR